MRPKRQTRLNFTPVSSSSPKAVHSSARATDRLANVRYSPTFSSPLASKAAVKREPISSSPTPLRIIKSEPSSDEDEDPIRAPGSAFRCRRFSLREVKQEPSSDDDDEEEEDTVRAPHPSRRTGKRPIVGSSDDSGGQEDSDSDDIVKPSRTKRRRHNEEVKTPVRSRDQSDQEMRDLEEDMEDLRDTATTKRRTRGYAAQSASKLRQKQQLEALRRRRAGERPATVSPPEKSESSQEDEEASILSVSTSSDEDILEDSDIEPAVPEDLDKYEDDFVLEDDDAEIGAPAHLVDMPFEFSRHRYKRLRDHFRDVVEWMVHNKLNPAFSREDEVYKVAFIKVNDEVTGVAGSQLVSSVWSKKFIRALEARPGIEVTPEPHARLLQNWCDACNRSKHPPKFDIRFTGKPYLLETLEPVYDDEDSIASDDVVDEEEGTDPLDRSNIDREGRRIADESTHFYVGKFCKAKATMAHTLIHWRFRLNEWVIDYLERKGVFSNAKILEREHWSVKKKTRYANEVVDEMQEKEIDRLWKDFNLNLKGAKQDGGE
ncbi:uncharacterized protein CIMG_09066 [Coccidioides immitis RS]|uniref:DUF4211 domain-containing protein n=1 Tax=Coccidioides immitis (strain RS) TaxID=246410 RepID=A0A0D8JW17_COCIM|nr:uncharacterized protein CIMG_09066 [Coccidioides immitis RS]KJF61314.1 hypothetical protein CIMG_09066 [Coccidioides immitis RS]TPX20555.1 hypothetical protein DIZ76_016447 [Coccidioides immitis]